MKIMTRIGLYSLALLLVSTVLLGTQSRAAGILPINGVASKYSTYGEGNTSSDINIHATQYFKSGKSLIKQVSSTVVSVSGETEAYSKVDTIAVDLYLQQWNASRSEWIDVLHVGESKNYNSSFITSGVDVNVKSGYYYRTRAHHWINAGGTIEQGNSYTSYIYVD